MSISCWFSKLMIAVVAFTLCGGPQLLTAQQTAASQQTAQADQSSQPEAQQSGQSVGTTPQSATPDPSKGPLAPNENPLPNAPSTSQQTSNEQHQQGATNQTPLGAAAAQAGRPSGGAASKPAGIAIAPAKQHQTRSLLIKVGAIAAGGAALGIVYGLSRGTSSVPPGASTTTTTSAAQPSH